MRPPLGSAERVTVGLDGREGVGDLAFRAIGTQIARCGYGGEREESQVRGGSWISKKLPALNRQFAFENQRQIAAVVKWGRPDGRSPPITTSGGAPGWGWRCAGIEAQFEVREVEDRWRVRRAGAEVESQLSGDSRRSEEASK